MRFKCIKAIWWLNVHVFNSSNWSTPTKKSLGLAPNLWIFWGRFSVHGHLDSTIEAATNINNIDHSWLCHPGTFQISLFGTKLWYSFITVLQIIRSICPCLQFLQICIKLLMLKFFWELPFSRDFNILGCNCKYYIPPSSSSPSKPIL